MKLWQSLYAIIWIVLMEFLLVLTPTDGNVTLRLVLAYGHVGLGLVILGLTYLNFNTLRMTRVPARVKRIAKSTFRLSILMAITGFLLVPYAEGTDVSHIGQTLVIPVIGVSIYGLILLVHVVNAFAIITQAAAVAIAHDMWEDKEFVKETEIGEVPAAPSPMRPEAPKVP